MFQPADLRFIQRRQVRFLFGQVHAAVLQCRIQLVQLRHIVILFVHGTADLLRCQGMVACPRSQCSGQFLRLRQFLHGSCSFPLLLQPEGKAGIILLQAHFPASFRASTGGNHSVPHWTYAPLCLPWASPGQCGPDTAGYHPAYNSHRCIVPQDGSVHSALLRLQKRAAG